MPIVVKPFPDNSNPSNPFDRRGDGFDPLVPYQMIPLGSAREMIVQTRETKAEMNLVTPEISFMSNFRILRQQVPSTFPLPGPGVFVRRIALPEKSEIQFTLSGRALGTTILEGQDRSTDGRMFPVNFRLQIAVKPRITRQVAVCYVFDRINRDSAQRLDFPGHLAEVHKIFFEQANFTILNIDGGTSGTTAARTLTLSRTMGKKFDMGDDKLKGRICTEFDAKFPGVFGQVHCVLFSIPVPLRFKSQPKSRFAGLNQIMQQTSTGRKFNTVLLGTQLLLSPAKRGGPRPSNTQRFRHVIAHELGHSLGLSHNPNELKNLPPLEIGKETNPELFNPIFHNLMFPSNFIPSDRINAAQVEVLHSTPPPTRDGEF